ncbi:glycosyltransferase [Aliikangiella sp. IMCC44359]|uniref:glycosyltransferase n=1 Tax=Aliikangiella sp. IMCC44359 TaxID=3459125 RepID=UPI00403AE9E3
MNKTLLVIGYVWPEPNSSAAGSHMLSLLRLFKAQNWRVVFSTPAQNTDHMIDLAVENIESVAIELNNSNFDQFAKDLMPDYVLFDRFMMEEQFGWRVENSCPNAVRILDTEDLQCLRGARQNANKENRELQINDLYQSELAKREIAAILRSDLSLIISDFELQLLENTFNISSDLIHHLPFMLNLEKIPTTWNDFSSRQHFITIGNFRHAPNWDSVLYLQTIWPLIRQTLPEAELHIYGSYPPKKATALNNPKTGFLIKGWAEDALEVIANARVCLSPLRFGAGIKGKLIDAMQVGTPNVTTSMGAEGMSGELNWPGIIKDTPESIAQAAISLYRNQDIWYQAQQNIRPLLKERYDGTILGQNLIEKLLTIEKNLTQHRLNNFTGSMLRHHSMRSTQYFSKWIEAKNQCPPSSNR